MKRFIYWLQRQRDKLYRGPFLCLLNDGNFYVVYKDGKRSRWVDYSGAKSLRAVFDGEIRHKNQPREVKE